MPQPSLVVNVDSTLQETIGYQWLEERVRAAGGELILCRAITEDQLVAACGNAMIVVVESPHTPITARFIGAMTQGRAIVKCAVGTDNIDVHAASGRGLVVCSIADYCTEEVSDHTVGLILASVRRIPATDRHIRCGGWIEPAPRPAVHRLCNLTLGIIGLGRIGSAVVRKLRGFEMRILATDPYLDGADEPGVELVPMERLLRKSDLISLPVPLTPGTRNLIGGAEPALMQPSAMVVNTNRGPVSDEEGLIAALQEQRIAGAALDVAAQEPISPSSPLRGFPNVILAPHNAYYSEDSAVDWRAAVAVADSVDTLMRGYWPPFAVNPGVSLRAPLLPSAAFPGTHH